MDEGELTAGRVGKQCRPLHDRHRILMGIDEEPECCSRVAYLLPARTWVICHHCVSKKCACPLPYLNAALFSYFCEKRTLNFP